MWGGKVGFRHGLAAVFVLALLIRVAVVLATPNWVPETDAVDYDRMAVSVAQHGTFPSSILTPNRSPTAFRPPLFPIALAGVYAGVGVGSEASRLRAGRLIEALLGAVAVLLICLIAARLWVIRVALVAGVLASIYPPLVLVGSSLLSESLFIPLVLAAVLAALVQRQSPHGFRWTIASGLLLGAAALTRSNGIVLVIPIGFLVWTKRPRLSFGSLSRPMLLVGVTLLTLVPWTVRNADVLHGFVPISTESGFALAGTYNSYSQTRRDYPALWAPPWAGLHQQLTRHPGLNEAAIESGLDRMALRFAEAHPAYVLKVALWNTVRLLNLSGPALEASSARYEAYPRWLAELSVYAFWILALLALAGATTSAARRVPPAVWGCPLVILLSSVLILGMTRYRAPADPFFVMLAALAVAEPESAVRRVLARRPSIGRRQVPSTDA